MESTKTTRRLAAATALLLLAALPAPRLHAVFLRDSTDSTSPAPAQESARWIPVDTLAFGKESEQQRRQAADYYTGNEYVTGLYAANPGEWPPQWESTTFLVEDESAEWHSRHFAFVISNRENRLEKAARIEKFLPFVLYRPYYEQDGVRYNYSAKSSGKWEALNATFPPERLEELGEAIKYNLEIEAFFDFATGETLEVSFTFLGDYKERANLIGRRLLTITPHELALLEHNLKKYVKWTTVPIYDKEGNPVHPSPACRCILFR